MLGKLGHLSPADRALVERMSVQMLNKFLHAPTSRIKQDPGRLEGMNPAELVRFLFGLEQRGGGDDREE